MAVIDAYRAIAFAARAIPGQYGLHPHAVAIGTGAWSGSNTGGGLESITWTPIVESGSKNPKVRWLKDDEIAIGGLQAGTVQVGPITPAFPGGGTSTATLLGTPLTTGKTLYMRITGPQHPNGALYRVTSTSFEKAIHYTLRGAPVTEVTP